MRKCLAFAALFFALGSVAQARLVGQWVVGSGQGTIEYAVYLDSNDQTFLRVSDGSDGVSGQVEVVVSIAGQRPPPKSKVTFRVGPSRAEMYADAEGAIGTACHVCAANFDALWAMMRSGSAITVSFGRRTAVFPLRGTAKVLGRQPPIADFYR